MDTNTMEPFLCAADLTVARGERGRAARHACISKWVARLNKERA